jgi:AraC-like DNA-binding protein
MAYRERALGLPGAVLWQREVAAGAVVRVLPDGCLDLIWDGERLHVAGPDTRARLHRSEGPTSFVGLRFSGGVGAAALGVPADQLRDRSLGLDDVWSAARTRQLTERVGADPLPALETWLLRRMHEVDVDPLGLRVAALGRSGLAVGEIADAVALSPRQLHRRCEALFGYGPQHLSRVLRLLTALDHARRGAPLARVASDAGYADQAHLARDMRDLTGITATEWLAESAR